MELTCATCLLSKPLDAFGKGKNGSPHGRRQPCKQCRHNAHAAWRATQPIPEPATTKICARCKADKSLDDFQAVINKKTLQVKHISYCKPCRSIMRSEDWQARKGNNLEGLQAFMHAKAIKYFEYNSEYSRTHRPQINAWKAKNKAENLEDHQAYQRQWANGKYATDEDFRLRRLASSKRWEEENPEQVKIIQANRRAREAGAAIIDLSAEQWLEILQAFNFRCAYCPTTCKPCQRKTHKLEQDHITSVANRGDYTLHNIVPACRRCNAKKSDGPAPVPVQPLLLTVAPSKKKKP